MSYKALLSSPSARKSIEILAAVIDSEVSHDAPEIRFVSNSLKELLHDPTHGAYLLSVRAFMSIDRDIRKRIQNKAKEAAEEYTSKTGNMLEPIRFPRPKKKKAATGLLGVLNFGGVGRISKRNNRQS